jgi:hypothetical protein
MSFTESAEGAVSSLPASATKVGQVAAKLAGWGVATVAVTFMLLRPNRRRTGNRGGLFFGSGVVVVLCKTLLMVNDGSNAAPAAPSVAVAAAIPEPAVAVPAPAPARPLAAPKIAKPKAPVADASVNKPAPAKPNQARAATAPQRAKVTPVAPASAPAKAAPARPGSPLGPRYADKSSGYSVQFPAGWTYKTFDDDQCWVIDATDGQSAVMSVGFSQFPSHVTVDQIVVAKVTKGLQGRAGTVVHGSGYATVGGRRSLWHKYTGPIPRTDGKPRMTAVHYLLPLQDGRALEVRVAATPEKFNEMAPRMKQSLDSFKLLAAVPDPRTAKAARGTKEVSKG